MLALPPLWDPPAEHYDFGLLIVRQAVTRLVCTAAHLRKGGLIHSFIYLSFLSACCSLSDPQMAVCDSQSEQNTLVITVQSAVGDKI